MQFGTFPGRPINIPDPVWFMFLSACADKRVDPQELVEAMMVLTPFFGADALLSDIQKFIAHLSDPERLSQEYRN